MRSIDLDASADGLARRSREFWFAQARRRGLTEHVVEVGRRQHHRSAGDLPSAGLVPEGSAGADRTILLGRPGAGTNAVLLQLMCADLRERETAAGVPVPVRVSLDGWSPADAPLEDAVLFAMMPLLPGHRLSRRWELAQALLRTGRVRPFVDGTELGSGADAEEAFRALGAELGAWTVIARDDLLARSDLWESLDATVVELLPVEPAAAQRFLVGQGIDPAEEPWPTVLHRMGDPATPIARTLGDPGRLALAASLDDPGLLLTAADEADLRQRLLAGRCDQLSARSNGNPLLWLGLIADESVAGAELSPGVAVRLPWLRTLAVRWAIAGLVLAVVGIAVAVRRDGVDPRLLAVEVSPELSLAMKGTGYILAGSLGLFGFSALTRMNRRSLLRLRSSVQEAVTSWTGFGMLGWWAVFLPALVLTVTAARQPPDIEVPEPVRPWALLLLAVVVTFHRRLIPPARAVGWLAVVAFFLLFRSRGRIEVARTPLAAIRAERQAAVREGLFGAVVGVSAVLGTVAVRGGAPGELVAALALAAAGPGALIGFYRHPAVQNELGVRTGVRPGPGRAGLAELIGDAVVAGVLEEFPTGLRFRSPALHQHLAEQYRQDRSDPQSAPLPGLVEEIAARSARYWEREIRDRDLGVPAPVSIRPKGPDAPVVPFDAAELERRLDQIEAGADRVLYLRGGPGSGRTSLLVVLLQSLLERRQSRAGTMRRTTPVPVYVSLSGWRPSETSLVSWLKDHLARDHPVLTSRRYGPDLVATGLDAGLFTIFVDDLDTGSGAGRLSRQERSSAVEQLERLSARVRMVVACAPTTVGYDRPGGEVLPITPEMVLPHLVRGEYVTRSGRWRPIERHLRQDPDGVLAQVLLRPAGIGLIRRAFRDEDPVVLLRQPNDSTETVTEDLVARCLAGAVADPEERHQVEWWLGRVAVRAGENRELAWWDVPQWAAKGPRHVGQALLAVIGTVGLGISLSYSWPLLLLVTTVGGLAGLLLPLWRADLVTLSMVSRSRPAVTTPRYEYRVGRGQALLLAAVMLPALVPVEYGIAVSAAAAPSWPETVLGAFLTSVAFLVLILPAACFRVAVLTSAIVHRRPFRYFRLMDAAVRAGLVHQVGAVHRFADTDVQSALARSAPVPAGRTVAPRRQGRLAALRVYLGERLGLAPAGPSPFDADVERLNRRLAEGSERDPRQARRWEELGRRLEERYRTTDRIGDLRQARDAFRSAARATPWLHPDRARRGAQHGRAVVGVYRHTGDGTDLESATKVFTRLLEKMTPDESEYPALSMELGQLLLESGLRGQPDQLAAAVGRLQAAVDAVEENDVRRAPYLRALATGLESRSLYLRRNQGVARNVKRLRTRLAGRDPIDADDLDTAVALREEALRLVAEDRTNGTDRERYETELRVLRQSRYTRRARLDDLDEADPLLRPGVDAGAGGVPTMAPRYRGALIHPVPGEHHTDRAAARLRRHQSGGAATDLAAALDESNRALARPRGAGDQGARSSALTVVVSALLIHYEAGQQPMFIEEAIRACAEQTPARSGDLLPVGLLGNARLMRYWHSGDPDDLADAVTALETAAGYEGDAGIRSALLSNLACALLARHADGGPVQDVEAAVDAARRAVTGAPRAEARLWSNYGTALLARYLSRSTDPVAVRGTGEPVAGDALDEALNCTDHAVARFLADGREVDPAVLVQRAVSLRVRFERDASFSDLATAHETLRALLERMPTGHRQRSVVLIELGHVAWLRHVRIRAAGARQEALAAWQEATGVGPVHDRILAARAWGRAAFQSGDVARAAAGYEIAINLLPELAAPGLARAVRQHRLARWSGLAAEAATVAVAADLPERAVGLLEQGRWVLWNQDLRLRAELLRLRTTQPELAAALTDARSALDAPAVDPEVRRRATAAWDRALEQVRSRPGESTFLRAKPVGKEAVSEIEGTTVVLNASVLGCHAIVVQPPDRAGDGRPGWARTLGRHAPTGVQRRRLRQIGSAATYLLLGLWYHAFRMYINGSRRDWTRLMQASLGARLREGMTGLPGFMVVAMVAFGLGLLWAPLLIVTALVGTGLVVAAMIAQERGVRPRPGSAGLSRAVRRLVRLVDPAAVRVVALPQVTAAALVEQARRLDRATVVGDQEVEEVLEWLWDAVAEPVLTDLGHHARLAPETGPPRVWWLPVGVFGGLPIHAAGRHGQSPTAAGNLANCVPSRVVSSYLGTLSGLDRGRATAVARPRQLAVGVPDAPGQPELRGVSSELANLKAILPEPEWATHLVGAAATKPAVLADLPRFPWLHLACHVVEDGLDPAGTGFALHGPADRSRLTVAELATLPPVPGYLAYLAACRSATGALRLSDESVHLAAAMQVLGYPHVVATWWPINDRTSERVSNAFYRAVLTADPTDPDAVARALHGAVEKLRLASVPASHWAAYVHLGP